MPMRLDCAGLSAPPGEARVGWARRDGAEWQSRVSHRKNQGLGGRHPGDWQLCTHAQRSYKQHVRFIGGRRSVKGKSQGLGGAR